MLSDKEKAVLAQRGSEITAITTQRHHKARTWDDNPHSPTHCWGYAATGLWTGGAVAQERGARFFLAADNTWRLNPDDDEIAAQALHDILEFRQPGHFTINSAWHLVKARKRPLVNKR